MQAGVSCQRDSTHRSLADRVGPRLSAAPLGVLPAWVTSSGDCESLSWRKRVVKPLGGLREETDDEGTEKVPNKLPKEGFAPLTNHRGRGPG